MRLKSSAINVAAPGQNDHPYATGTPVTDARALDVEALLSGAYWAELRTFLGLAKSKSISRTAGALGLNKATISRHIQRLQDVHKGNLLVTSTRGVILTEQGQKLAALLIAFDQAVATFASDVAADPSQLAGTVRLSVTDGLGVLFVVPALTRLARAHPRLRLQLKTPRNMKSLRENQTDIMVGFSEQTGADLTTRRLGTAHLLPIASRAYVEHRGMPTPQNLSAHDFIDSERYASRGGPWEAWHGIVSRGRTVHAADASITYAMMVKAGLGIGLLTSFNVLEPAAVPLDLNVTVSLPVFTTALSERLNIPSVRAVFDFVCALFSPASPWFGPQLRLDPRGTSAEEGYALLFNIGRNLA